MNRALLSGVLINCARVVCHNSPTHVLNALTHNYLASTHFAKKKKKKIGVNFVLIQCYSRNLLLHIILGNNLFCFDICILHPKPSKKTKQKTKIGNYFKG